MTALLVTCTSSIALAQAPNAGVRGGANHHTGDDAFVSHLGREPEPGEETLRMHEHFVGVRDRLAGKPATRPELEAKRKQILGHLDAYIAKGTTPKNDHLPWRTPVFIDDEKTICAVGYLIEQTAGRPLAEKVAAKHRYDYIEDIAKDMPEVRAWVEQSGFTLDELGQIQPGYMGPEVLMWGPWKLANNKDIEDGDYTKGDLHGTLRHRKMEGVWESRTDAGFRTGLGTFHRGAGTWTSFYPSGVAMATGEYAANIPAGTWKFFHESGNLAAEGAFVAGVRSGAWKFYYDTKDKTPIAIGKFKAGAVVGMWKHYDAKGTLLATSAVDTPNGFEKKAGQLFWSIGYLIDVKPGADRIQHQIHKGSIDGNSVRLDVLSDGKERVYLRGADEAWDDHGNKLVRQEDDWQAQDCHWSKARKRAARAGDVAALNGLIHDMAEETCGDAKLVSKDRAARISKLVDAMQEVRSASPAFIKELSLGEKQVDDLTDLIASNMSLDIEWPHVDGRFLQVFKTLPGYSSRYY